MYDQVVMASKKDDSSSKSDEALVRTLARVDFKTGKLIPIQDSAKFVVQYLNFGFDQTKKEKRCSKCEKLCQSHLVCCGKAICASCYQEESIKSQPCKSCKAKWPDDVYILPSKDQAKPAAPSLSDEQKAALKFYDLVTKEGKKK